MFKIYSILILTSLLVAVLCICPHPTYGIQRLQLVDPALTANVVVKNLSFFPTSMAFLNNDDILVTDKDNGEVRRILNGSLLPTPLLKMTVSHDGERGLLGIVIDKNVKPNNVYLYLTENETNPQVPMQEAKISNRIIKFDFIINSLFNPKLIFDLPALPGPNHNGGALLVGPDDNLYFTIGDVGHRGQTQNVPWGSSADLTGGILRVTKNGSAVDDGLSLGSGNLSYYYSYGIRNSFGIDFDPVTGNLWDSENGEAYGDEINYVPFGFNSGWMMLSGKWSPAWSYGNDYGAFVGKVYNETDTVERVLNETDTVERVLNETDPLVNINNRGNYSAPELMTANFTIGPTAIKFFSSDKLGEKYKNALFVGDNNNGNVYKLDLDGNRTGLKLPGSLADKIADTKEELREVIFGKGFGKSITDIEEGPDGYLYVLSAGNQTIFQIHPKVGES